jgi:hypothetical protein
MSPYVGLLVHSRAVQHAKAWVRRLTRATFKATGLFAEERTGWHHFSAELIFLGWIGQ